MSKDLKEMKKQAMELSEGKMFQGRANSLSKGLKVESTTGMFEEQYAILAGVSLLCWL